MTREYYRDLITAFNANAAATLANIALATAMAGEPFRDPAKETCYARLKCHAIRCLRSSPA